MATQRAIDARKVLRDLLAQVSGETVRLRDTAQSLIAHANRIRNDVDVAVVDEVLVDSADGGETSARLQHVADTDLVVSVDGSPVAVTVDLARRVVTFSALSLGNVVTATYTGLGLRSEIIELYAATGEAIADVVTDIAGAQALITALGPYLA